MFNVINFNMCTRFILCALCPTCYSRRADRAHTGVSLLRLSDQNLFRTTKAAQSQSVKQVLLSCTEAECGRVLKGSHKGSKNREPSKPELRSLSGTLLILCGRRSIISGTHLIITGTLLIVPGTLCHYLAHFENWVTSEMGSSSVSYSFVFNVQNLARVLKTSQTSEPTVMV